MDKDEKRDDHKRDKVKILVGQMLSVNLELAVHSPASIERLYVNQIMAIFEGE